MKPILHVLCAGLLAAMAACGTSSSTKPGATGNPFDVLVVIPDSLWMGPAGDTLKVVLEENPMILPQPEPMHSVVNVDPARVTSLLLRQRNVILFEAGGREQPAMTVEYDVYSTPQAVVRIAGPSAAVMTDYMAANRFALQGIFELAERERAARSVTEFVDRAIRDTIRSRFGLSINIPRGYMIRGEHPGFIWISYEPAHMSQGLMIYKYPLAGRGSLLADSLLVNRDRFVRHMSGSNPGSHMRTADHVVDPLYSRQVIDGRVWIRYRGLWDLEHGFQGGPFDSYTTVNATTGEVITVDLYVYSPGYPKRNPMKYLEGIMHTARVPGDTTGTVHWADTTRNPTDTLQ